MPTVVKSGCMDWNVKYFVIDTSISCQVLIPKLKIVR
jgi:hypothetical protein